jgi:hypothetical protein
MVIVENISVILIQWCIFDLEVEQMSHQSEWGNETDENCQRKKEAPNLERRIFIWE